MRRIDLYIEEEQYDKLARLKKEGFNISSVIRLALSRLFAGDAIEKLKKIMKGEE
jgi:predicted CopG family antitoxin